MRHVTVLHSTDIASFGYEYANVLGIGDIGTLAVTFHKSGTYEYLDVPVSVYWEMLELNERNESIGKAVFRLLKKGGYEYRQVAA